MSMAMRRQLGMAPNKSPSKASSAAAREPHPTLSARRPCPVHALTDWI